MIDWALLDVWWPIFWLIDWALLDVWWLIDWLSIVGCHGDQYFSYITIAMFISWGSTCRNHRPPKTDWLIEHCWMSGDQYLIDWALLDVWWPIFDWLSIVGCHGDQYLIDWALLDVMVTNIWLIEHCWMSWWPIFDWLSIVGCHGDQYLIDWALLDVMVTNIWLIEHCWMSWWPIFDWLSIVGCHGDQNFSRMILSVSDYCFTTNEQFFSYNMARTIFSYNMARTCYILKRWWQCPLCSRPTRWVGPL